MRPTTADGQDAADAVTVRSVLALLERQEAFKMSLAHVGGSGCEKRNDWHGANVCGHSFAKAKNYGQKCWKLQHMNENYEDPNCDVLCELRI